METQTQTQASGAKDFFINLGAIVALYTLVYNLISLLFTVINKAYPQITNGYDYMGSTSISWPVATLVIFFPIFILLMWLLEREYKANPEKQSSGIHKWLTYITLFIAGLTIAGDLITVLYYFIDGQELTTGFLLKVLVLLVIAVAVFAYYLSDVLGKLTAKSRNIYRVVALLIIIGSVVWGFSVLGSPRTQQLFKYDEQKVNDLQSMNSEIQNYFYDKKVLPQSLSEISNSNYYISSLIDKQNSKPYEYIKTNDTSYQLCAEFNKDSKEATTPNIYARPIGYPSWTHSAGHYCFTETVTPNTYTNPNLNNYPKPIQVQ